MFKNVANNERVKFAISQTRIDIKKCSKKLDNIPIKTKDDNDGAIPKKEGFQEMYNIVKVEQLNIINRLEKNVPINHMGVIVGIGKYEEKIS